MPRDGLPGRYFSIVVPNEGRIELIGYDGSGHEVGRVGSLDEPARRTDEGLIPALGDPAVFGPTAPPVSVYTYRGGRISSERVQELGLACVEDPPVARCYDSVAEAESVLSK